MADTSAEERIHELESDLDACREFEATMNDDIGHLCYNGNSVSWWCSKAQAYKDAIGQAWDVLRKFGVVPNGGKDVATAIREAVEAERKACAEIARADMEYYAGLYKISKGTNWGEAEDAAEVIAMNIEARGLASTDGE